MKKILGAAALTFIIFSIFILTTSNISASYTFTTSIPGTTIKAGDSSSSIAKYIEQIYNGALAFVGLTAFAAIVFWGIKYTMSVGNASKTQDAVDGITQAVFGLVLLLSAYLILKTVNPTLVNLKDPDINTVQQTGGGASGSWGTGTLPAGCEDGGSGIWRCTAGPNANVRCTDQLKCSSICTGTGASCVTP